MNRHIMPGMLPCVAQHKAYFWITNITKQSRKREMLHFYMNTIKGEQTSLWTRNKHFKESTIHQCTLHLFCNWGYKYVYVLYIQCISLIKFNWLCYTETNYAMRCIWHKTKWFMIFMATSPRSHEFKQHWQFWTRSQMQQNSQPI